MTSVLLAESYRMTRVGLRAALRATAECHEAPDHGAAVAAAGGTRLDVALVATDLHGGGIATVRELATAAPGVAIVALSPEPREDELLAAVLAGATGYVAKGMKVDRLPALVEGVISGEAALPRGMTPRLLAELRGADHRRSRVGARAGVTLTAREWQVLELLGDEAPTARMALELGISEVTVRRHVSSLLGKLDVPDRAAAVALLRSQT
jgi:DNA-binding NarL/FixJ family response regulator